MSLLHSDDKRLPQSTVVDPADTGGVSIFTRNVLFCIVDNDLTDSFLLSDRFEIRGISLSTEKKYSNVPALFIDTVETKGASFIMTHT